MGGLGQRRAIGSLAAEPRARAGAAAGSVRGWVLVAEDTMINQRVAVLLLKKLGYHADVVANGREAVAALANGSYDLLLMDCEMPEVDGFDATRAIRAGQASGGRRLPIIALTANASPRDRQRCMEAGMDDCLTKPVTVEALRTLLDRWIGRPATETSDPEPKEFVHEAELLDPQAIDNLLALQEEGAPDVLDELFRLFLTETPRKLRALGNAIETRDASSLERAAHSLKSSAAMLGARTMARLSGKLEALGEARTPELGARVLTELAAAFEDLRPWLVSARWSPPARPGDGVADQAPADMPYWKGAAS